MSHAGKRVVIAGVGQSISRWRAEAGAATAPSPGSLRLEAARAALGGRTDVDVIAVVRTTEDSVPTSTYPNGRDANPPGTLARDLGLRAGELVYSAVGGQTPQELVNELASRIHAGEIASALVVGAEAVAAAKAARRAGLALDWSDDDPAAFEDRGAALDWLCPEELRHGLITPGHYYGLAESTQITDGLAAYRDAMGDLLAPFSETAARSAYAQFPVARTANWLATESSENYAVAYPYLKWHVAQDAVNQGAAIVLMREDLAGASALAWLRAGASATDAVLTEREDMAHAGAAEASGLSVLEQAGITAAHVDAWDLYSCFPIAVWSALDALDLDTELPLTQTGGLQFFGGPGNNYSLHAIAAMAERLSGTDDTGCVLANGGWMSKVATGLYSGAPCDFIPPPPVARLGKQRRRVSGDCHGRLEAFTFTPARSGVIGGTATVLTEAGHRAIAQVSGTALARLVAEPTPIGADVEVTVGNGIGRLSFRG